MTPNKHAWLRSACGTIHVFSMQPHAPLPPNTCASSILDRRRDVMTEFQQVLRVQGPMLRKLQKYSPGHATRS